MRGPTVFATQIAFYRTFGTVTRQADAQCPFRALGLDSKASADELRSRYLELAKKLHPDAVGADGASLSNAFVDLRRTYERALQLQKRSTDSGSVQTAADTGCATFWGMSTASGHFQQLCEAVEEQRRQWEKDQEARRAFWAGQSARLATSRWNDREFSSTMARLFRSRVDLEAASGDRASLGSVFINASSKEEFGYPPLLFPAAPLTEREAEKELRFFGLTCGPQKPWWPDCKSNVAGENSSTQRMWMARKTKKFFRTRGRLLALSTGIAVIALTVVTGVSAPFFSNEPGSASRPLNLIS